MSAADLVKLYEEMYKGEKLIRVQREIPEVADISGKHGWTVGGFQMHSSGKRAVVVVRAHSFKQYGSADSTCRACWIIY